MDHRFSTRFGLSCGVIGPLLFVVGFLIEGATRPGYSPWRHVVSQLSLGDQGWINSLLMFICGLFLLGFAFGLKRAFSGAKGSVWGPRLTLLCGVLLIIAAIFPINPALGYPPGDTPSYSLHGLIHALAGTIFFGCLSALCFVIGQRLVGNPDWKGWGFSSRLTGVMVAGFYLLTAVVTTLDMNGLLPDAPGGLLERLSIISGLGWIMLLALRLLRHKPLETTSHPANVGRDGQAEGRFDPDADLVP
jgi:hypothetical protein